MRGRHFQGKPKQLEDHFKEVAQTIARFAKAREEQIRFLNIFDHDPAWHFTWEAGNRSRTEELAFTNHSSDSSSRKILSKNAHWTDVDVSEVMETDLILVLIYHSTPGLPLSSAKRLDDVLDAFKGVLKQLAMLNDHNFIHRDVSYANIFIREFQTNANGGNGPVVG
ncbi:hypothetical protein BT69DRAFT_920031 [Atractiella rhizophila]|nr:hypothetical protein BT69DRAFT_920031 [Atractiella rhizophila]